MKFTFNSEFVGFGSPKTQVQFEADQLEDILMYFRDFLKGAGYEIDGVIDVIPNDEYYGQSTQEEYEYKEELPFANFGGEKCSICGMTREKMGQSPCFDVRCGLGLNRV